MYNPATITTDSSKETSRLQLQADKYQLQAARFKAASEAARDPDEKALLHKKHLRKLRRMGEAKVAAKQLERAIAFKRKA